MEILWRSIGDPQHFALLLLHEADDLSANVRDTAALNHTCNKQNTR